MLGTVIDDPHDSEGGGREPGFGMLPIATTLQARKTVRPVRGRYVAPALCGEDPSARELDGYEVHTGLTSYEGHAEYAIEHDGGRDGAVARDGAILGSYVHGLFGTDAFRHAFVGAARTHRGLAPADATAAWRRDREARIDRWAQHVAAHLDLAAVRALVTR